MDSESKRFQIWNSVQIIVVVVAFLGLCGWFFSPLWAASPSKALTTTPTPVITLQSLVTSTVEPIVQVTVLYKIITATPAPTQVPSSTPAPTQTARIIYRVVQASPYPTFTPEPTSTPFNGVVLGSDGCFIFNLYGVSKVFADRTPVAPAFGMTRVCASRIEVFK